MANILSSEFTYTNSDLFVNFEGDTFGHFSWKKGNEIISLFEKYDTGEIEIKGFINPDSYINYVRKELNISHNDLEIIIED